MNTLLNLLQIFAATIKELFVAKEDGKGLSTNDLTNAIKANYDAAHTHSQGMHAPTDAQSNVLECVKVNGVEQSINDKTVNISIPTDVSQFTNNSEFQTSTQVSNSITSALTNYSTTTDMNTAIANAVGSAGHLKREVMENLPAVESADSETIYMIQKTSGKNKNIYDEFMLIEGAFEKIGDTEVDLTGYIQESDIEAITAEDIEALFVN